MKSVDTELKKLDISLNELQLARMETRDGIKDMVETLVKSASELGLVLTVTQQPRKPLAMGNYETVVEVRPAREMAK